MFQDWGRRIVSQQIPVYWAGFESNTYRLQQAGWEFSAEQDHARMQTRLLMRHQAYRFHGCTAPVDTDFFTPQYEREYWKNVRFPVQWMTGGQAQIIRIQDNFDHFSPVDMQPQFIKEEVQNIEDMNLFAAPMARTQEIIVDPDSVSELMDRVLKLQEPARKEHFREAADEMRRGGVSKSEYRPRQQFHAQILSLVA